MTEVELAILFLEREIKKQYLKPIAGEGRAKWGTGVRPKSMGGSRPREYRQLLPKYTKAFTECLLRGCLRNNCDTVSSFKELKDLCASPVKT